MPTTWRVLDRVDAEHLDPVRAGPRGSPSAGVGSRCRTGPRPGTDAGLRRHDHVAHWEKENAAATWKRTFGFHPLLCFLDRPDISGGEALAGLLRQSNAGSNTAADHITVLDMALAGLPDRRPTPTRRR